MQLGRGLVALGLGWGLFSTHGLEFLMHLDCFSFRVESSFVLVLREFGEEVDHLVESPGSLKALRDFTLTCVSSGVILPALYSSSACRKIFSVYVRISVMLALRSICPPNIFDRSSVFFIIDSR